jgi:hypothetical protein
MRKKNAQSIRRAVASTIEDIRDYAFHLYEQSGCVEGRELENWLEAEACLRARIPRHHTANRLHTYMLGMGPAQQAELCYVPGPNRNLADQPSP